MNVNLLCPFSAQGLPILLQNNETLVVLIQAIILNIVALCRNEISDPTDIWHKVINSHDFCLRGYFFVDILLFGANNWKSTPQR